MSNNTVRVRPAGAGMLGSLNDGARVWMLRLVIIAGLLVAWQLVSLQVGGVRIGLPGPVDVARSVGPTFSRDDTWVSVGSTLRAWSLGFVASAIGGLVIGALCGAFNLIDRATRPTIDFFRTIPSIAVLPLGALILGVNVTFEVAFIVFGAMWPILIQTMYGVAGADPTLVDTSRLLRMPHRTRMRLVLIPGAIPFIATGVRLSAVMAFLLAISVELLSGAPGLGSAIRRAQFSGQYAEMYLLVLTITLIGAAIGTFFVWAEVRVKRWSSPVEGR